MVRLSSFGDFGSNEAPAEASVSGAQNQTPWGTSDPKPSERAGAVAPEPPKESGTAVDEPNQATGTAESGELEDSQLDESETVEEGKDSGKKRSKKRPKKGGPPFFKRHKWKIVGFSAFLILAVAGAFLYLYYVNPPVKERDDSQTAGKAVADWNQTLQSKGYIELFEESYLSKEYEFAAQDASQIRMVNASINTLKYETPTQKEMTIWGKVAQDTPEGYSDFVPSERELTLTVPDWEKVSFEDSVLEEARKAIGFTPDNPDYEDQNKRLLTKYIDLKYLPQDGSEADSFDPKASYGIRSELPTKEIKNKIKLAKEGTSWVIQKDEDFALDKLLFGTPEFKNLVVRFEDKLAGEETNPLWDKWNALPKEEQAKYAEPNKRKPQHTVTPNWIGVASMTDGEGKEILPRVGDGTAENPAGLDTPVSTIVKSGKEKLPIRVKLVNFMQGQEAVDFLRGKDARNRGLTADSRIKIFAFVFEVENRGDKEITVTDNSGFVDYNSNPLGRTGNVDGLATTVKIPAGKSALIESWNGSVTPNRSHLIWGRDFSKDEPLVWFRVLGASSGEVRKGPDSGRKPVGPEKSPSPTPSPAASEPSEGSSDGSSEEPSAPSPEPTEGES